MWVIDMLIVGIAGGTGSGKATFAEACKVPWVTTALLFPRLLLCGQAELSFSERLQINYDNPNALER